MNNYNSWLLPMSTTNTDIALPLPPPLTQLVAPHPPPHGAQGAAQLVSAPHKTVSHRPQVVAWAKTAESLSASRAKPIESLLQSWPAWPHPQCLVFQGLSVLLAVFSALLFSIVLSLTAVLGIVRFFILQSDTLTACLYFTLFWTMSLQ